MIPIIIPSLDPEFRLLSYCRELRLRTIEPIILVDDGSAEANRAIFENCKAEITDITLLRHDVNRGKGRALKTAFKWVLEHYSDAIGCVTVDSDGQHLVKDVLRCMDAAQKDSNALVLGCRVFTSAHVPWKSSFGNTWMKFLFLAVTGRKFMDTQTGLRVIPRAFMERLLNFPGERFEFETEMLLGMESTPLVQVPIETVYEEGNKSTHFRPLVDSWKVVKVILRSGVRRIGRFVLSSLSSFVIDAALFWLLYEVVFNEETRGRLWWAILLARVVSMTYNYLLNEIWVFKVRLGTGGAKAELRRLGQYLLLAVGVFLGAYLITKTLCAIFTALPVVALKVSADFLMFILAYLIQRIFIFKAHK